MKSDPSEYIGILEKLLDKTRQRRVEWVQSFSSTFECALPSADGNSFRFIVSAGSENQVVSLRMSDESRNTIFAASSNDLPTSPEEEQVSQMIEEIYELARRQALKVEQKLELASTLLDRV